MISQDPLSRPVASPELVELSRRLGQKIVHISLATIPTLENPTPTGPSFLTMVDFLPRVGELIRTENGKLCKVVSVLHCIRPFAPEGRTEAFGLFPTVFALSCDEK